MTADITFNEARHELLEAVAEDMETSLLTIVREYNHNDEFKRRIDMAALNISSPTSNSIH
jgi:hypothetical protein